MSRKEIYTYEAPWTIFAMAVSNRPGPEFAFRFAVGSFVEEYTNKIQIIQLDDEKNEFVLKGSIDHPYPATKILWAPELFASSSSKDLFATTGDYLRLWQVNADGETKLEAWLNNNKNAEYCAPITSFDWNILDTNIIGTSSIDTTCTIWDINQKRVKTQLIAHDKEVYDIAWARSKDVFATVGADGSVRMFDLRTLEHSTIMYESHDAKPLLRLAWNKEDSNYIATFAVDSTRTVVLDLRMPTLPVAELVQLGAVTGAAWAPQSASHICTVGDDCQALIWDLSMIPRAVEDPILAYNADGEVNQLVWNSALQDWVNIAFKNKMQMLRV